MLVKDLFDNSKSNFSSFYKEIITLSEMEIYRHCKNLSKKFGYKSCLYDDFVLLKDSEKALGVFLDSFKDYIIKVYGDSNITTFHKVIRSCNMYSDITFHLEQSDIHIKDCKIDHLLSLLMSSSNLFWLLIDESIEQFNQSGKVHLTLKK